MTDQELYHKASQAAHDYRTVHGSFPDKIGIHHERLQSFPHRQICFAEIPDLPVTVFSLEEPPLESMTFKQHIVYFEPVVGESIKWDEVYLPIPGEDRKVISGKDIALMAQQKERRNARTTRLLGR